MLHNSPSLLYQSGTGEWNKLQSLRSFFWYSFQEQQSILDCLIIIAPLLYWKADPGLTTVRDIFQQKEKLDFPIKKTLLVVHCFISNQCSTFEAGDKTGLEVSSISLTSTFCSVFAFTSVPLPVAWALTNFSMNISYSRRNSSTKVSDHQNNAFPPWWLTLARSKILI